MFSFARTKIQPPSGRAVALIERPALEARLRAALLTQRLVLVSASAGFGKTSALARQVEALPAGTAVAWIACDEGDTPAQLFECLVAALEPIDPPWRTAPDSLIAEAARADTPEARRRVTVELLNALDACDVEHGVIMVDDLHRVTHPHVHQFLEMLLERLSPRWTLAIATRVDPPIALARLRARGELAEFRSTDLGFDVEESRRLAGASGLDAASAERLHQRTAGWPAGLRLGLAGAGLGSASTGAIDRRMFEFLASEVIDQLPADLRSFLVRCSVLPELTAVRCAAVSGDRHAGDRLDEVVRRGLFASVLDEAELTLRLHDLFRAALEQRLHRDHADELPQLLRNAAAEEADPVRRIDLLIRAGDLAAATSVLRAAGPAMIVAGRLSQVTDLLGQFPAGWAAASAEWHLISGFVSWARWDFGSMVRQMRDSESAASARGDVDAACLAGSYRALALNAIGQIHSLDDLAEPAPEVVLSLETRIARGVARLWIGIDVGAHERIGAWLDELVDLLHTTDDPSMWYRATPIARLSCMRGTGQALERYIAGALRRAGDEPSAFRSMVLVHRGLHELMFGHLDAADATLATVESDQRWLGRSPNVDGMLDLLRTVREVHRGDGAAALAAAQTMLDRLVPQRGATSIALTLHYAARVAGAFGVREVLRDRLAALQAVRLPGQAECERLRRPLKGTLAWLEGDADAAIRCWRATVDDEARSDRIGSAVEVRLRLAAALVGRGDDAHVAQVLDPLPAWIAEDAGLGGLAFARDAVETLAAWSERQAAGARWRESTRAWRSLLARAAAAPSGPGDAAAAPGADARSGEVAGRSMPASDPAGLSAREREVLERIAAGDSNKLIARSLELSPHTVKRHVANILDKLALGSRGQAAAWWRQNGHTQGPGRERA